MSGRRTARRAAVSGLATLAPLVALGTADHADAKRLVVKNLHEHGKGSFAHAVRKANGTKRKDTILFASKLSGTIDTPSRELRSPVALKASHPRLALEGADNKTANLNIRDRGAGPAGEKASAIRGLNMRDVRVDLDTASPVRISDSIIRGDGRTDGSGLYAYYTDVDVKRTTIRGWGIGSLAGSSGEIGLSQSVIAGNDVGADSDDGGTVIRASTLSGNDEVAVKAEYYGASAIHNSTVTRNEGLAFQGPVTVDSATVVGNGGVANGDAGAGDFYTVSFENSIIAGNAPFGVGPQCFKVHAASKGGNVFDARTDCSRRAVGSDQIVDDAGVRPLAKNGGPTKTRALEPDSPAIGGANHHAHKRDQRGVKRDGNPDSGAYELVDGGSG